MSAHEWIGEECMDLVRDSDGVIHLREDGCGAVGEPVVGTDWDIACEACYGTLVPY